MAEERAGCRGGDPLWYAPRLAGLECDVIPLLTTDAVSQFTLYTQLKQGNESDFEEAADIETARRLYDYFYRGLREAYNPERVKNGNFPAMMDGEWMNDGPVGFTFRSAHEAVRFCPL